MEQISISAELVTQNGNEVIVQFTVKLTGSMLDDEQALQRSLNEAGQIAMQPMLKQFDTNGEPTRINGIIPLENGNKELKALGVDVNKIHTCIPQEI